MSSALLAAIISGIVAMVVAGGGVRYNRRKDLEAAAENRRKDAEAAAENARLLAERMDERKVDVTVRMQDGYLTGNEKIRDDLFERVQSLEKRLDDMVDRLEAVRQERDALRSLVAEQGGEITELQRKVERLERENAQLLAERKDWHEGDPERRSG